MGNARYFENFISVNFFGLSFYHPYHASVEMKVHTLKFKNRPFTKSVGGFISAMINKRLNGIYSYSDQLSSTKLKTAKLNIQLPVKNNEIDFNFMEEYMSELEKERILELEASLRVMGLKDYNLTKEEQKALDDFDIIEWEEFKMGSLFKKITTKKLPYKASELPKDPINSNSLPCLTSSFQNQGLNYFAPKENATILKNVISIPSNSDVYRAYFQSRDFTVLSDAYAIEWIHENEKLTPNQYLFTVPCINKVTDLKIYSYKNKLGGWNVVQNKNIALPVKDDKPDYQTMEILISAVKKLAIKDVVLYVDKKIS